MRKAAAGAVDPGQILTASEIANYSFCPAAWHQQRIGARRDAASIAGLEDGSRSHQKIAMHARRAQALDQIRGVLLLIVAVLLVAACVLLVTGSGALGP
jgi:hypothetical protein